MGETVLLGKLAIAVACAAATLLLVGNRRLAALSNRAFDRLALGTLTVTRLGFFAAIFVVLGVNGEVSDIAIYVKEGRAVLDGAAVYRDVKSSYAPLFDYMVAAILWAWDSYLAFILVTIGIELAALPFWLAAARARLDEPVTRAATVLYATSPIPLINVALNGQNQVWQTFLMAIAVWLLARRDVASGLVYGLTLAAVKLLGLLFAPVLWLFAGRRLAWLVAFAVVPIAAYVACFALIDGLTVADVRYPIDRQGAHVTSGNPTFLLTLAGIRMSDAEETAGLDEAGGTASLVSSGVLVLALITVFLIAWRRGVARWPGNVFLLVTIVLLTTLLFGKKSYPSYLVLAFFPLCVSVASIPLTRRWIAVFGTLGIAAVLEPSLYFRWIKRHGDLELLWASTLPDGLARWQIATFLLVEIILIATYVALFVRTWRAMEERMR